MTDKEQIKDSLKNHSQNFSENSTQEKEQIIIDGCNVSGCEYACNTAFGKNGCKHPMMKNIYCSKNPNCYFKQLARKTQECEELKRKLSNQEQLYQNEIEIYDKSCLQLRQENDDLYLERLALNTANSGINALLEVKEQECDRYLKALEEIEKICLQDRAIKDVCLVSTCFERDRVVYDIQEEILDILNKAKGGGECQ